MDILLIQTLLLLLAIGVVGDPCPDYCNEDAPPPDENMPTYTCEEQKNFGACGADFMKGYCECTCGVCQQEIDTDESKGTYETEEMSDSNSFSEAYQEATSKYQFAPPPQFPSPPSPSSIFYQIPTSASTPTPPSPSPETSAPPTPQYVTCGALFALSRQLSLEDTKIQFGFEKVQNCLNEFGDCGGDVVSDCCSSQDYPLLCQCDDSGNCGYKLDGFSTVPSLGLFVYFDMEDNQCKCPLM